MIAEITGRQWIWAFPENSINEAFCFKKIENFDDPATAYHQVAASSYINYQVSFIRPYCADYVQCGLFLCLWKGGDSHEHLTCALNDPYKPHKENACHLGMPPRRLGWHGQEA